MIYDKAVEGKIVYFKSVYGDWIRCRVDMYIGDQEPNPGRELLSLKVLDYIEYADQYEMVDASDIRLIPSNEPIATDKQMAYLKDLGYTGEILSKSQASDKINELKAWENAVGACHYCGAPAGGFGFFDEPACAQCGGKDA